MTPTTTTRKRRPVADPTATDVALPDELVPTDNAATPSPPTVGQNFAYLPASQLRPGPHNPRSELAEAKRWAEARAEADS